jgi:hypothetical protein
MCYVCWVNSDYTLPQPVVRPLAVPDLPREIPTAALIGPDLQAFNRFAVTDGVFDIYLHESDGAVAVGGGPLGEQTINAVAVTDELAAFLQSAMERLSPDINLDIRFTTDQNAADLRFYLDSEFTIDDPASDGTTLGVAVTNPRDDKSFWEIFINAAELLDDTPYLNFVSLHEIGHALNLEHPFDNSDGDYFASTNPLESAFPEETVMSYRGPYSGEWPDFFSENDVNALKESWLAGGGGGGTTTVTTDQPTDIDWPPPLDPSAPWTPIAPEPRQLLADPDGDVLIGGLGNDFLQGSTGNDDLIGMLGADRLVGGLGANRFASIADGAVDTIVIQADGSRSAWMGKKRYDGTKADVITELGSEDLVTINGATTASLSFEKVKLIDSPYGSFSGFGVFAQGNLEAVYVGMALNIWQLKARTVGEAPIATDDLQPTLV